MIANKHLRIGIKRKVCILGLVILVYVPTPYKLDRFIVTL